MSGNGTLGVKGKKAEEAIADTVTDTASGSAPGKSNKDRRLPAALRTTAPIVLVAAVGFTLLAYLEFGTLFESSFLGGGFTVFTGVLAAGILW